MTFAKESSCSQGADQFLHLLNIRLLPIKSVAISIHGLVHIRLTFSPVTSTNTLFRDWTKNITKTNISQWTKVISPESPYLGSFTQFLSCDHSRDKLLCLHVLLVFVLHRPSVDGLYRDGTGQIWYEQHIKRFLTRPNRALKPCKSHSRTFL